MNRRKWEFARIHNNAPSAGELFDSSHRDIFHYTVIALKPDVGYYIFTKRWNREKRHCPQAVADCPDNTVSIIQPTFMWSDYDQTRGDFSVQLLSSLRNEKGYGNGGLTMARRSYGWWIADLSSAQTLGGMSAFFYRWVYWFKGTRSRISRRYSAREKEKKSAGIQ